MRGGRSRYLIAAVCVTICVFSATPIILSMSAAVKSTAEPGSVGKYWVVIVLWTVGFVSLIAFEMVAAIFRR